MDRFLPHKDKLGELLQAKAEQLFILMHHIDIESLGLTEHGKKYFLGSHFKRMFFSIQTSAHLLYNSINLSKKEVKDIVIMDYGAGMGSLYILAKMIGCKQVIHNDILEEWKNNAQLLAQAIHIDVDEYIVGNIEDTLKVLEEKKIVCDIITSRNVVEHIYKLDEYYKLIHQYQPKAIIYSSTTANFNNPAMNLQHVLLHLLSIITTPIPVTWIMVSGLRIFCRLRYTNKWLLLQIQFVSSSQAFGTRTIRNLGRMQWALFSIS